MLTSYTSFMTTVATFDEAVNALLTSADAADVTGSDLQAQKAALLTAGDVAGAGYYYRNRSQTHRKPLNLIAKGRH